MTARTTRVKRVESEILQILSLFLQHKLGEPLPCFASITAVEAHPNLRHARVYFRLVGSGRQFEETKNILEARRLLFQKEIAKELKVKFTPVLKFEFGASQGGEVDELLADLHGRSSRRLIEPYED
jgi:ribosome-binding factor A